MSYNINYSEYPFGSYANIPCQNFFDSKPKNPGSLRSHPTKMIRKKPITIPPYESNFGSAGPHSLGSLPWEEFMDDDSNGTSSYYDKSFLLNLDPELIVGKTDDPTSYPMAPSKSSSTYRPPAKRSSGFDVQPADASEDEDETHCEAESNQQRGVPLTPAWELWDHTDDGRYACLYQGPAAPKGCKQILTSLKRLNNHMREVHAQRELQMNLLPEQKIAYNGLPPELKKSIRAVCPLEEADLHKCRIYRETGRRWQLTTMQAPGRAALKHAKHFHDNTRSLGSSGAY